MLRRSLFFWIDRLQITPSERYLMTTLFAILLIISTLRLFLQPTFGYDADYYAPIEAEFNRLSAKRSEEKATLMKRYYTPPLSGTKETREAFVHDQEVPAGETGSAVSNTTDQTTTGAETETDKININKAGADQLKKLPGIGPVIAERIIAYRNEHGAFETMEQIRNVNGIGPARLDNIKSHIKL
ncbi:MAG: helix-hairpin-helix domain-containing protein [Balneolales bacterium]